MSELNEKQKLFCDEFLIDLNATQAAIRAGYSKKTARSIAAENLTKPYIQEYIKSLIEERKQKIKYTQEDLLKDLIEVKNRCMQAVPVMRYDKEEKGYIQATNEDGEGIWKFDSMGANKALDMLGKHFGFFETDNKQKQPIVNPVQTVYKTIKDKEEAKKHIEDFINSD